MGLTSVPLLRDVTPASDSAALCITPVVLQGRLRPGRGDPLFLRVMVGTGYPHPARCEFAYPPVYIDYIIILSNVEWTAVYRFYICGLRKRIVVGGEWAVVHYCILQVKAAPSVVFRDV